MKRLETIEQLRQLTRQWRAQGLDIGFVPTMGHLHAGHLALAEQALKACERVIVSIFVNPLQFNESSDFANYPKTLQQDQQRLSDAGVHGLFLPTEQLMYPQGEAAVTRVVVPRIGDELEGAYRPGHFDGVSTVVNKLFNLVQPQRAFFGEKDFQQWLVVKKMVADLNLPIEMVSVPTQREADGLAMSSRNSRLSTEQRQIAPLLYRELGQLVAELRRQSPLSAKAVVELQQQAMHSLTQAGFAAEYVEVREQGDLQKLTGPAVSGQSLVVLGAARLGDVRLIDNILLN